MDPQKIRYGFTYSVNGEYFINKQYVMPERFGIPIKSNGLG